MVTFILGGCYVGVKVKIKLFKIMSCSQQQLLSFLGVQERQCGLFFVGVATEIIFDLFLLNIVTIITILTI